MEKIIESLKSSLEGVQEEFKSMSGSTGNKDWEEGYANGWKDAIETVVELLSKKK